MIEKDKTINIGTDNNSILPACWSASIGINSRVLLKNKEIIIKDLTFKYKNSYSNVLSGFNLNINKGDFIMILGPSGSGKSTLINILLGLINPSSGYIYSDNVDVFDNLNKWRKKLSHVPQDVYLSDDTILSNVALGVTQENINEKKLEKY